MATTTPTNQQVGFQDTSNLLTAAELQSLSHVERANLLHHFRARIRQNEMECREILAKLLDSSCTAQRNLGEARVDLAVKIDESAQLQDALTEAAIQLFRERELVLDLQLQNDQIRVQEMDDRRRVEHLLELGKKQEDERPASIEEITFFRDCRPGVGTTSATQDQLHIVSQTTRDKGKGGVRLGRHTTLRAAQRAALSKRGTQYWSERHKHSNNQLSEVIGSSNKSFGKQQTAKTRTEVAAGYRTESVNHATSNISTNEVTTQGDATIITNKGLLRTIYLPSEQTDHLVAQVEELQQLLSDEKAEITRKIESIQSGYHCTKLASSIGDHKTALLEASSQLDNAELQLRNVVADLVEAKISTQSRRRQLVEENEMLVALMSRMKDELKHTKESLTSEIKSRKVVSLKDTANEVQQIQHDTVVAQSQLTHLRREYDAKKAEWSELNFKLEEKAKQMSQKLRSLKQRLRFDIEGFGNDLGLIAKQVAFLERATNNFDHESVPETPEEEEQHRQSEFIQSLKGVLNSEHHALQQLPSSKTLSHNDLDDAIELLSTYLTRIEAVVV